MRDTLPWPSAPGDLTEEKVRIPTDLFNMLAWLIAGDLDMGAISGDRVEALPMREHRHVLSIAQDIIYCTTGGYVKTPKHVALELPMAVRHLTGSTQLVTILNRINGDEEGDDIPLDPGL